MCIIQISKLMSPLSITLFGLKEYSKRRKSYVFDSIEKSLCKASYLPFLN